MNDLKLQWDKMDDPQKRLAADCMDQSFDNSTIKGGTTYDASNGVFTDGGTARLMCNTKVPAGAAEDTYVNTAQASATFEGTDPNGDKLVDRFNDGDEQGRVPSNPDSAEITVVEPKLELIKEVCAKSDGSCDPKAKLGESDWKDADTAKDAPTVKAGSVATWRITVINSGNVDLKGVKVSSDALTGGDNQADSAFAACLNKQFPDADAILAKNGGQASVVCSGPNVTSPFTPLVNTAQAQGTAVDDKGNVIPPFKDPGVPGSQQTGTTVTSNENPAQILAERSPAIALKKYVCIAADSSKCDNPPTDLAAIDAKVWADTGAEPDPASDPTSTDRAWLKAGDTARWLIVATNTGNLPLNDVHLTADDLSGMTAGITTNTCAADATFPLTGSPALLWPKIEDPDADPPVEQPAGKPYATAITCKTGPIQKSDPLTNTVNAATATGTPTDDKGKQYEETEVKAPTSETDVAKVVAGEPGLTLKKYACKNPDTNAGTGCTTPTAISAATPDEQKAALAKLGWMDTDDPGDHVFVEDGEPVQWLIVAQNTGTVALLNPTVSKDSVATGTGQTEAPLAACMKKMTVLDSSKAWLQPGGYAVATCQTDKVAATKPASEVVNTAQATGEPANPDDGKSLGWPEQKSNEDKARAQAAAPAIDLTKWVCAAGKTCAAADFVSAATPGPWVKSTEVPAGTNATWLIAVTNTGTVALKDVTLAADTLTAAGAAARASDGTTCVTETVATTLAVGQTKVLTTCTSTGVKRAESPLVNTAKASATSDDEFNKDITSNEDSATVTVPQPTPVNPPGGSETPTPSASASTTPTPSPSASGGTTPEPTASGTASPEPTSTSPSTPSPSPSTSVGGKTVTTGKPAISIVKQVCKWGTGCDVKTESDWVSTTTQPAGKTATWRIVVANTGNETLQDIAVTDTLSATRSGHETSCELASDSGDTLEPGFQIAYLCASSPVAITESGLVNSARATATGQDSGTSVSTPNSSAKVLVVGAASTVTLPFTGATIGAGGLAIVLLGFGIITLVMRRGRRATGARHAA